MCSCTACATSPSPDTQPAPSPFPVNYDSQGRLDFACYLPTLPVNLCTACELPFWPHGLTSVAQAGQNSDSAILCAECRESAGRWVAECDICAGEMYRDPEFIGQTEYNFCASCYDAGRVASCTFCGDFEEEDSSYTDSEGNYACPSCRRRRDICSSCGYWVDSTDGNGYCESCHLEEEDDESGPIRGYHDGPPNGWRVRRLPGEHTAARTYGVEIEVERGTCRSTLASAAEDVQSYGRGLFHCEGDGSLNDGFEIISQPCSLNYWADSLRAGGAARNMLDNARGQGLLSHDTSTCGLHVHVGRAALSRCTIYKLIAFANANASYLLQVSRRKSQDSLQRWAEPSVGKAAVTYSAGQLAKKSIYGSVTNSGRYVAINVCSRTVEIRIFRGSLIAATVLGAVQWADALVEWCTISPLATVSAPNSWREFCAFAASSPASANRAELAQSDLYCREYASRPRLRKGAAA